MVLACAATARAQTSPWDSVGRVLEAPATAIPGGTRYNFPRGDLTLRIGDVTVAPAIALVSWAAFGTLGPDTVVFGDLVVTPAEQPRVLAQLAADGISVTAVHNHLVGESPEVMFVHYEGHGPALTLAAAVGRALGKTGVPRPATRFVATGDFTVPGAKVDAVLDALSGHGITATAVHSHLVDVAPPLYYIHFWADGTPAAVVGGLRAALDAAR